MNKQEFTRRVLAVEAKLYRISCGLLKNPQDRMDAVIWSARDRVEARAAADGDTPKTRAFAAEVMRPVAHLAAACGVGVDMESAIEEEIGRSMRNA